LANIVLKRRCKLLSFS